MLRSSKPSYVCWRCLSRSALPRGSLPLQQQTLSTSSPRQRIPAQRGLGEGKYMPGRGKYGNSSASTRWSFESIKRRVDVGPPGPSRTENTSFRQGLKEWAAANPNDPLEKVDTFDKMAPKTSLGHGFTLGDGVFRHTVEDEVMQPLGDGDDMADTSTVASNLRPGDLVEISHNSSFMPILAVHLGKYHSLDHFYSEEGVWFTSPGIKTRFVVRDFVTEPADIQAVRNALPTLPDSLDLANQLDNFNPSREIGAPMIFKMRTFQIKARIIFQEHIDRFNSLYTSLGPEEQLFTLHELARLAFPPDVRRGAQDFSPEHLYALFTYLVIHESHFRALARGPRSQNSCLFAVNSRADVKTIDTVEAAVRDYIAAPSRERPSAASLDDFILQARKAIDRSRESRDWSPHGMIGPSKRRDPPPPPPTADWSPLGLAVIRHMYLWAATDMVTDGSNRHWIGSAILRLIDRYGEAEYQDPSVGWAFLQEIAYIAPWDLSARHTLRLPGVELDKCGGLAPMANKDGEELLGPDRLAHLRQDFGDATVYCIDAESATDIDDGISLEPTGEGDHWIHVHVADPASRIAPGSPLAKRAALVPQTMYLAGHYSRMLDDDVVRDTFSLGPDRPSLVFSARVTDSGEVIDHKITPATIRNVLYLTPETAASVTGGDPTPPASAPTPPFQVGTPPPPPPPPARPITAPAALTPADRSTLLTLHRLAHALHAARLARGAIPSYPSRPTATVSLYPSTTIAPSPSSPSSPSFLHATGDPHISIAYTPQTSPILVSSLMLLAGSVAARYLHTRAIPAPFRVQPVPRHRIPALENFTATILYPALAAGRAPSTADLRVFRGLAGPADISAAARPHWSIGEDMYVKATSPLRRAGDLLVHWQVEAALLQEAEGTGTLDVAALPFGREEMEDEVLPRLRVREQHARMLDNVNGADQWLLQALVRAWKFGEAEVPATMRFAVTRMVPRQAVKGVLTDWFEREASIDVQDLNGVVTLAKVEVGDVFVVRLKDVNVHSRQVAVEAVERVERGDGRGVVENKN
ncbi:hypothetical protein B0T18DRAFT_442465 [Schizothecium vesticola]|uniref:RNB domain-containing protein n=1 Tax=Schizothecium vesticola TaxID=314040 RepID=A0AA40FA22_9PEZI|nr:hypothetical protein B0T18DRAFT_442465 [Schizothecium vesticola]